MQKGTAIAGCVCVAVAFGCMVIAFASPYWVESFEKFQGRFVKLGLWEICFNDYTFYKDYNGKRYKGCWYIFSDQIRPIWEWVSPPWFIALQVMVGLSLLIQGLVAVCLILYVFKLFPKYLEPVVLMGTSGTMLLALTLIFISLVLLGVKKEDRDWVPRPDMNYLSWSYGLCCISGWFSLFSAVALWMASKEVKEDPQNYGYPSSRA